MNKLFIINWVILVYGAFTKQVFATCHGAGLFNPNLGCQPAGLTQFEELFQNIISVSVGLAFVALAVVLVWAGIKYLTSGGDAKSISSATQTVTWGLLGILFLAISWLILLLIQAFTGIRLTNFDIRTLCVPGIPGLCP